MDRKYIMKAEKAVSLSAFADYYGITAYDEKLQQVFDEPEIHPGQEIILCGWIGLIGTVYLAEHEAQTLGKTLPGHFIRSGAALAGMTDILPDPELAKKAGVTAMYQIGEGGLLNGLCRLAADSRTGFCINYEEVPVKQVTIEFCEVFDLNPWQLMSGGCVMMVAEHGYEIRHTFEKLGIPCQVIGYISKDQDKVICHGEIRSCLNRPEPDELLKTAAFLKKNM